MFWKELFILFTVRVLRGRLSVCECASFPFGFESRVRDLTVLVPIVAFSDDWKFCQPSS